MTDIARSRLWEPTMLGAVALRNRLVMAPMTRRRAGDDGNPTALMATYYAQRAGFGMLVTEGIFPGLDGRGYPRQPGLATAAQRDAWRAVTAAVHAEGGTIVAQLMHAGRVTHPDITGTTRVLAPSAVPYDDHHRPHAGPAVRPDAMTPADIAAVVRSHADAAGRAVDAGFDGVELHAGNGYLLHQFLAPSTNRRDDGYGGSPGSRARFVAEVAEAVADSIGGDRLGVRISPGAGIQGADEPDPDDLRATYTALATRLHGLRPAYLSVIHPEIGDDLIRHLRSVTGVPLVANTGFGTITGRHDAAALTDAHLADAVAVGRPAIANPDLARRWRHDAPEAAPDRTTFYSGDARGYIDYPTLTTTP
ncbi:alkene reductase [Catenuloplanes indicus]|uniref:2,4-dienoyl-CoA reductase-like NADH-dependent reductase (Old Yellow Enzyme family) n=1 Tax=Catenuloplanes indicus TaxID=137267 RepID=A0AAE3VV82_9ACTN|nr:alkene reductase [Catenuloplanes indicus]MDQ0363929.1 2,4-dienoyl-CoA reductase-like NADH-dependent reductase (Old Yellow Enzyme family) [Catenuloplanes indicus]